MQGCENGKLHKKKQDDWPGSESSLKLNYGYSDNTGVGDWAGWTALMLSKRFEECAENKVESYCEAE